MNQKGNNKRIQDVDAWNRRKMCTMYFINNIPKCFPERRSWSTLSKCQRSVVLSHFSRWRLYLMSFKWTFNCSGAPGTRMWLITFRPTFSKFLVAITPLHRPWSHCKVLFLLDPLTTQSLFVKHPGSSLSTSSKSVSLISPLTSTNCVSLKSRMRREPTGEWAK